MEKVRKYIEYTEITSYPHHANLFPILSAHKDIQWSLQNYYIQLGFNFNEYRFDFSIAYNINDCMNLEAYKTYKIPFEEIGNSYIYDG